MKDEDCSGIESVLVSVANFHPYPGSENVL